MGNFELSKSGMRKLEKDIEKRLSKVKVDASQTPDAKARDLQRQMKKQGFDMTLSEAKKMLK